MWRTPSAARPRFTASVPGKFKVIWKNCCRSCWNVKISSTKRSRARFNMKIAIGSDHRGFEAKRRVLAFLRQFGHDVIDVGASGAESVDYPDFAYQVASRVSKGEVERGI